MKVYLYASLCCFTTLFALSHCNFSVSVSGHFEACDECVFVNNSNNFVQWGTPTIGQNRSGLEFIGFEETLISPEEKIQVGFLNHHNWPIQGSVPQSLNLTLTIHIQDNTSVDILSNFTYTLIIDETNNRATSLENETCPFENGEGWFGLYNESMVCCPYFTPERACSDKINFLTPFDADKTFFIDETEYTLKIQGFVNEPVFEVVEDFITQEVKINRGIVQAELMTLCASNFTCNDNNPCTFDECIDGFCDHNPSTYEGETCIPQRFPVFYGNTYRGYIRSDNKNSDDSCYHYECMQGGCVKIQENCTVPQESSSDKGGDDDDDELAIILPVALASSLATLCLLLCLLCSLLVPALMCVLFLPFLKETVVPGSIATVDMDPIELQTITTNPIYDPIETVGENPLFE